MPKRCTRLSKVKLERFRKKTIKDLGLSHFWLFTSSTGDLKVSMLEVPHAARKLGTGSKALARVVDLAEDHGLRVVLEPGSKDPHHGTTSRSRLIKFYKRSGFVENKGRNKDFVLPAGSMYREPQEDRCRR